MIIPAIKGALRAWNADVPHLPFEIKNECFQPSIRMVDVVHEAASPLINRAKQAAGVCVLSAVSLLSSLYVQWQPGFLFASNHLFNLIRKLGSESEIE